MIIQNLRVRFWTALCLGLISFNAFATVPKSIDASHFDEAVLQSKLPVLIYVSATWCAPCQIALRTVGEIVDEYVGKLNVYQLDFEKNKDLVERLKIQGFPTTLMFDKGQLEDTNTGWHSKADLKAFIEGNM